MKLQVGRITVAGNGLEARRLADRLAQDLPAALTRALTPGSMLRAPGRDPVDRIARTIAQRVRAELAHRQLREAQR